MSSDYMNLIKAFSAAGRPQEAKEVLKLMTKRSVAQHTYS